MPEEREQRVMEAWVAMGTGLSCREANVANRQDMASLSPGNDGLLQSNSRSRWPGRKTIWLFPVGHDGPSSQDLLGGHDDPLPRHDETVQPMLR